MIHILSSFLPGLLASLTENNSISLEIRLEPGPFLWFVYPNRNNSAVQTLMHHPFGWWWWRNCSRRSHRRQTQSFPPFFPQNARHLVSVTWNPSPALNFPFLGPRTFVQFSGNKIKLRDVPSTLSPQGGSLSVSEIGAHFHWISLCRPDLKLCVPTWFWGEGEGNDERVCWGVGKAISFRFAEFTQNLPSSFLSYVISVL